MTYGTAALANVTDVVKKMADFSDKALQLKDGPLKLFLAQRRITFLKEGYNILKGFADTLKAPAWVRRILKQLDSFLSATLKSLKGFMLSTLRRKHACKEE